VGIIFECHKCGKRRNLRRTFGIWEPTSLFIEDKINIFDYIQFSSGTKVTNNFNSNYVAVVQGLKMVN
jgi:hypothetical protein